MLFRSRSACLHYMYNQGTSMFTPVYTTSTIKALLCSHLSTLHVQSRHFCVHACLHYMYNQGTSMFTPVYTRCKIKALLCSRLSTQPPSHTNEGLLHFYLAVEIFLYTCTRKLFTQFVLKKLIVRILLPFS